jgi:UDP-N-acetylglucosamine diphosphorylase / glucose-1-phosphate thymidylyltransferase / UDP-N-acetylgalactosamine diphosphorylase / glucosamine-1-phosphate N-acetyltransferase / galactosamine-1-phosphate N-acetyltransferase
MSQPLVLVLAGGASNRFWPLRDKQLVRFGSQSLLERHLRALLALGCRDLVVVARPQSADEVASLASSLDGRVDVVLQEEARGMADAVICALPALEARGDRPIYVTQAHDVVEQRLHADLLETWAQSARGISGLLGAARVSSYFPGGYLTLSGQRVTAVIEKPTPGSEPSDLVNLVAHLFSSWQQLKEAIEVEAALPGGDDVYERALTRLMQKHEFRASVYDGRWQGLKYPWHLLDVMDMLLDLWRRGLESPGEEYEALEDGVFVGRDVRVYPGAHAVGPALLEEGVVVGHNGLVRASIVGRRSVTGFGSEIARSYVAEEVELHHNYVGDSVLERGSSMGYGAVTANYRLDGRTVPSVVSGQRVDSARMKLGLMLGEGAKIGVQTSTMPGVKIGAGAMIGPSLKVTRDVPGGERVLDEEAYGRF